MALFSSPKLDGLNAIGAATDQFQVSIAGAAWPGVTATIVQGDYYIHSHTGAPADGLQLIERFDVAATAAGAPVAMAVSDSTGRVTVTNTAAVNTLDIRFHEHTGPGVVDIGVLLGLIDINAAASPTIGVLAPGASFTGPNGHYHGWYPNTPPVDVMGDDSLAGFVKSDAVTTVAPSGRVVTTKFHEQTVQRFAFEYLDDHVVLPLDATVVSYQQFWQRILSTGQRFRYYPDRTDRNGPAGAGPFVYVAGQATTQGGASVAKRSVERWLGVYNLDVDCHLYVA